MEAYVLKEGLSTPVSPPRPLHPLSSPPACLLTSTHFNSPPHTSLVAHSPSLPLKSPCFPSVPLTSLTGILFALRFFQRLKLIQVNPF